MQESCIMKKSILAIAVAATMAAPAAVMAAPTVYGNVHLSLNQADNDIPDADNNLSVSSNTSAIGVKGSEDLGDGLKAIYKVEFGVTIGPGPTTDPDSDFINGATAGGLTGRDQFMGLKGGFGAIKFGTMSSNYKQMGGKVDPLYRTPLEGRGFLNTQSKLHGGKGMNRGRQTHTAQYVSPKMAGIQLVANTTFSGSNDETSGIGIRWSNKAFLVYADYITGQGLLLVKAVFRTVYLQHVKLTTLLSSVVSSLLKHSLLVRSMKWLKTVLVLIMPSWQVLSTSMQTMLLY